MHLAPLIYDLAAILVVAGAMSLIFNRLRQPVVLGYILAGIIVGPHTPPVGLIKDHATIETFAELGVIFLMFTLGLEFSFRRLLNVGFTAIVAGGLEVLFFLVVGNFLGRALGLTPMESLFLGAMLAISSTTIIIKALDELKLRTHRFAGLIFGILVVEDLLAILLIVALTTIASSGSFSFVSLASTGGTLLIVVGSWFLVGYFIVPKLIAYVGRRGGDEMLTLVSLGLCLGLVVVSAHFGYSPALGAFIMGSILAETRLLHKVEALTAPFKDLFGAIFFVSIGMLIDPRVMWEHKGTILILCVVTIVGKVFITGLGALVSGQSIRTSLQVGLGLAQIGEFSFIIAGLGVALKAIGDDLYPIAVGVSFITTFTTPYLIKHSGRIAGAIENKIPIRLRLLSSRYSIWWEHQKGMGLPEGAGKKLSFYYKRLETIFSSVMTEMKEDPKDLELVSLAPWDSHLIKIEVHPNALIVNKTLARADLRKRFGLNVVAIQRGIKNIVAPGPSEIILPRDTLVILGTDEQIEAARLELEMPEALKARNSGGEVYLLRNLSISPDSALSGKTIRQVGLRESYHVMVVGIERSNQRIINPDSDFLVQTGDVLWIVGEQNLLNELFQFMERNR